jgi:uncharacterized protein YjdB
LAILATVGFTSCEELAVEDNPMQAYMTMRTGDVTLKIGDTYLRKAVVAGTAVVVYSSSDETVATVDQEGKVTAIAAGTATITAQTTGYNAEGKKIYLAEEKSYKVTVKPATATSLSLDKANLRFDKNVLTAQALTPTVTPSDAAITWTSSNENVATVDANGQVTPKAKGTATITAKAGDLTATSTIYVYDKIWNVNTDGAANVAGGEFWLIEGNGSEIGNAITINASPTTTITTVTLNGINITNGIECLGDATIILADGSTNTVKGSFLKAGIVVGPSGTTLTIDAETAGDGKLNATGSTQCAGIGTSYKSFSDVTCGDITINGGIVTAIGGQYGAGIGTGLTRSKNNTCGAITINGGTVTATGRNYAAGIGTGWAFDSGGSNTCGAIAITANVTSVTAIMGTSSPISIGMGTSANGGIQKCGTITFGTVQVFDGTAATGTWTPSPMAAGTYGGLNLAISTTTAANDTWTLTPVTP